MKQTIDDYILNVLTNMKDKKIIVTGATSGFGLALARLLVFKQVHLIMAVRNMLKGTLIKEHFLEEFPDAKIDVVHLDISDFNSVDEFVENISSNFADYHSLIINAEAFNSKNGMVLENGFPLISGTNLFGPIYLVNKLVSTGSRKKHKIIFQGSMAKSFTKYHGFNKSFMNAEMKHKKQYNLARLGLYNAFNYFHNGRKNNYFFYWAEPGISGYEIIRRNPLRFGKFMQNLMNSVFAKPLESCLPAASICNNDNLPSGISVAPDGLFHISGLPTIIKFNPHLINLNIAKECLDSINEHK